MICPYCSHDGTRVTDSRATHNQVWRRRECLSCKQRFTTAETIDIMKLNGKLLPAPLDTPVDKALETLTAWRDNGD
jgi:hypothetical protein